MVCHPCTSGWEGGSWLGGPVLPGVVGGRCGWGGGKVCCWDVVDVEGEFGGFVALGVGCGENQEEVSVGWELPDVCGMCV